MDEGWGMSDTKALVSGGADIFKAFSASKVAEANASAALDNRRAIDSQLNAQQVGNTSILDNKPLLIGGGVALTLVVVLLIKS